MKKINLIILIVMSFFFTKCVTAQNENKLESTYCEIKTDKGDIIVALYDKTPLHRDNFKKLIETHYYDSLLFHRVIKDFMIQAGDPTSKNASPDQNLGVADIGYKIPSEINKDSLFIHKRGALAGARDGNPRKESSGSQFYIVQGKTITDEDLNNIELFRGIKYTPEQREIYKSIGGAPHLDSEYTVFGEVVKGLDVVDNIASCNVNYSQRPINDIRILSTKVLSQKEVKKLIKNLNK